MGAESSGGDWEVRTISYCASEEIYDLEMENLKLKQELLKSLRENAET